MPFFKDPVRAAVVIRIDGEIHCLPIDLADVEMSREVALGPGGRYKPVPGARIKIQLRGEGDDEWMVMKGTATDMPKGIDLLLRRGDGETQ